MEFVKLGENGHSWDEFVEDWRKQCEGFGECLEDYASAVFPIFESLVRDTNPVAGIYCLKNETSYLSACQLNCANLPGYPGSVLRVRHLTVSPKYDFGDSDISEYAALLIDILLGIMKTSELGSMKSDFVNFHLRSPTERQLFAAFGTGLDRANVYKDVKMSGAWLYITK